MLASATQIAAPKPVFVLSVTMALYAVIVSWLQLHLAALLLLMLPLILILIVSVLSSVIYDNKLYSFESIHSASD